MVKFVQYWGNAGLDAIDNFERKQKHTVGVHTFNKMSAVADAAYLEKALGELAAEKPTTSRFLAAINHSTRLQWYTWHVMAEGNNVHPDRSVHPLIFVRVTCVARVNNAARCVVDTALLSFPSREQHRDCEADVSRSIAGRPEDQSGSLEACDDVRPPPGPHPTRVVPTARTVVD